MKNRDIPKDFINIHNAIIGASGHGRVSIHTVFEDFLDISISNFMWPPKQGLKETIESRYGDRKKFLGIAFNEWVSLMNKKIVGDTSFDVNFEKNGIEFNWNDSLGDYYMELASSGHQSALGQYFTPSYICDMMSLMVCSGEPDKIETINDPACGSGRMLLAGYCAKKGKAVLYAEDMDMICCKMTVLNLFIHGCTAEVICHNSLLITDFRAGWHINKHKDFGILGIQEIEKTESSIINRCIYKKENKPEEYKEEIKQREVAVSTREENNSRYQEQLKLF